MGAIAIRFRAVSPRTVNGRERVPAARAADTSAPTGAAVPAAPVATSVVASVVTAVVTSVGACAVTSVTSVSCP